VDGGRGVRGWGKRGGAASATAAGELLAGQAQAQAATAARAGHGRRFRFELCPPKPGKNHSHLH